MKPKREWLVGRWEISGEHNNVIFEITKAGNGFHVRAFDKADGEEFIVSKTQWDGSVLSFDTYIKSNQWRTRNRLRLVSKTQLVQELTIWETWKKIDLAKIKAAKGCTA